MFVAACLYEMLPTTQRRWQVWPVIPIIAVLGLTIGYGRYRLTERLLVGGATAHCTDSRLDRYRI